MRFEDTLRSRNELVDKIGYNQAYLVAAVALFIDEADIDALASVGLTEGGNDKKIDFIYHDTEARRLVFAQGYMSTKNNDTAPSNKASDLNTACAWLVSGDVRSVPEKLRDVIIEFRQSIETNEIEFIDLLYVHNLPESINVSRELHTVEEHLKTSLGDKKILVKAHELGKTKIEYLLSSKESHIEITDDIPFPAQIGINKKGKTWSAAVASVSGEWIHQIYTQYGDKLYSANYRGFLGADGRRRVNSGIRGSAEKTPADFCAFNNGITILTLDIQRPKPGKSEESIVLKGISIINGAQTSGSIGSVDTSRSKLSEVSVLCRIIQCSDQDTIDNIVRFNNTQNVITTWDRFSNDQDQRRIEEEFKEIGYDYNRKRGFSGTGDQIGIEQVLQPLIAFHGRPRDAVRGKGQLFVQNQLYRNAFESKKARHILFVYALARAINNKRLELKIKSDKTQLIEIEEKQLALLRNLNFKAFLMAVIAKSLETVLGHSCDPVMVGFSPDAAKGSTIAELAARWSPMVDAFLPLLTVVVEPSTFFKKLSSEDGFLETVKGQMNAMLSATQTAGKFKSFAEMVAKS